MLVINFFLDIFTFIYLIPLPVGLPSSWTFVLRISLNSELLKHLLSVDTFGISRHRDTHTNQTRGEYHSKSDLYLTQWLIFIWSTASFLYHPLVGGSLLSIMVALCQNKVKIWYHPSIDINSNLVRICLRIYDKIIFAFQRTNQCSWNTMNALHVSFGFPFCYHLIVAVLAADEYTRKLSFRNKNSGLSFLQINVI